MDDFSVTTALAALADGTRRALFERLVKMPQLVGELAATAQVSRSAVSQHLRVLREAGMVLEQKIGRQVRYEVNPIVLHQAAAYLKSLADAVVLPVDVAQDKEYNRRKTLIHTDDAIDNAMLQWAQWSLNFDPLVVATITRMRLLSTLLEERYSEVAGRYGLTVGEAIVMGTLRRIDNPAGITPGELARVSVITPPSLAKHLRTLEPKGLIVREEHPADRRSHRVRLSPRGIEVAELVIEEQLGRQYAALFALPEEDRKAMDRALRALMRGLREDD